MRFLWYTFLALVSIGMLGLMVAVGGAVYAISYYSKDLPDYSQLKDYKPPVVTRVYAGDGRLVSEFAKQKRVFVPVEEVPDILKQAFIAAEDQNFYTHHGLDYYAIARAAMQNFKSGGIQGGASTITQQVAKNFLLSSERTYKRKIREAILALRMERALSKHRLLELYLNEIYLGEGSYGVAAASLNYFNKSMEELTIPEAAFLAALPKAPNDYHPVRRHEAGLVRRNWVVNRMVEEGYITHGQGELAKAAPLRMIKSDPTLVIDAPYFTEEVRRQLITQYGEDSLYGGGLAVRTSMDPKLQEIAVRVLREGLVEYDKRHGYRGPLENWASIDGWQEKLQAYVRPESMLQEWKLAVVLSVSQNEAAIGMEDGTRGQLLLEHLKWARPTKKGSITFGPVVTSARDVVRKGDVIMVDEVILKDETKVTGLRQIPEINGALVAMDPHTGRVLALQGGWAYTESEFNRATQAKRQPGSAFKPFVYLPALDSGFTPATLVLDAPFVIDQGPGLRKWRPTNYNNEFYGPTPLRVGIEKSRNLMTVRLAEHVGMETIAEYVEKFGVMDHLALHIANCLGSGETTLLRLTTGYAQFVNGGKKITPTLIDRIQDRRGVTVFSHDNRRCEGCGPLIDWKQQTTPIVPDTREQISDPRTTYQMVSMLEGVVQRGTGTRIKDLNRPLAGKTGTTNESKDTWFIGFSPDLVVGVFVGFDEPRSLGRRETGASVSVPVFKAFMAEALEGTPPMPFRIPRGVRQMQINAATGERAQPGDEKVIWEAFLVGTEPNDKTYILDGKGVSLMSGQRGGDDTGATVGTGGLY